MAGQAAVVCLFTLDNFTLAAVINYLSSILDLLGKDE